MSNGERYQCASHTNGGPAACDVSVSLPRERAERIILNCIEVELLDPKRLAKLERLFQGEAPRPALDHARRITELDREIHHMGDAIGKGLLSDAIAARLQAAELERGRLIKAQANRPSEPRKQPVITLEQRVEALRQKIAAGGKAARSASCFPNRYGYSGTATGRICTRALVTALAAPFSINLLRSDRFHLSEIQW